MAKFMEPLSGYTYALLRIVTGLLFLFHGSQKLLGWPLEPMAGLPAFITTSEFGYEHVDLAVGRFGLFVRGPAAKKDDVEKVASALVAAIK